METEIEKLYASLHRLVGLHRQLLELVRQERKAIENADVKAIHEAVNGKEVVIHSVRLAEAERVNLTTPVAMKLGLNAKELSLGKIILALQTKQPQLSEKLKGIQNTLSLLMSRISTQNKENQALIERSLEHVNEMKGNILSEAVPRATTYTQKGQKAGGTSPSPRLISKEA